MVNAGAVAAALSGVQPPAAGLELSLSLASNVYDGRFANNGWLQELPQPLVMLTWDNALLVSPKKAKELELKNESLVTLTVNGKELTAKNARGEAEPVTVPVLVLPAQ